MVEFQNRAGISLDYFMTLLEFELASTFVCFNERLSIQRKGICIGSCVAPILSNIFLSRIDRDLELAQSADAVLKFFRYIDEFLTVLKKYKICLRRTLQ